ncbi:MAG TPA: TAT-variant-translocated molybdopterin oxidoreductase, partial [Thermoanaerobaculia bacterium]
MDNNKTLDFQEFRARVGDLRGKEYWRSLEELSRSDAFDEFFEQEFPQQAIPLTKGFDRRSFVKLMGASVAMAGLAACKQPAEAIVPYVNQPENLIPGKPLYFASAMPLSGYATGVLVESHMHRPTKIDGNPDHPSSLGASDAYMQASILNLYDPDRSQVVRREGEISTWSEFVAAMSAVGNAAKTNAAGVRILTGTITSPTLGAQLQALLAKYPGMRWHQWEPAGRDNMREGARLAFGSYVNPVFHFDRANVIVSLGADFCSEGPGHLRYARDFAKRRKVRKSEGTTGINRLYAIESSYSSTGSVADHRVAVKPSQIEGLAREILAGHSSHPVVAAAIRDLQANRGAGIVVAGEEMPAAVHALAHAINSQLGNIGTTVSITDSPEVMPVNQLESFRALVTDMHAGRVQTLVILGGNPVFDAPADFRFLDAFKRVPLRVHLSPYFDETSYHAHWHIPETHYLETWGDSRGHDGTVTIQQPLIAPLYNGRSALEVVGAVGGVDLPPYQTVRNYWFSKGATEDSWRKWLNDGVIANSALPSHVGQTLLSVPAKEGTHGGQTGVSVLQGIELQIKHDPTIYDGRFANNGWLQELPKPHTKITWDNVLLLSPKTADRIGYDPKERDGNVNERRTRMADVTYRGVTMRLPIWVVPGHAEDVATVYYGYGREKGGRIANGVGFNTYPFRRSDALHGGPGVQIRMSDAPVYPIACTQEHQSLDRKVVGERGIIRAATFAEYQKTPNFAADPHHAEPGFEHGPDTMYPAYEYKNHA